MCGIVGYLGNRNAAPVLFEGLKKLEYRGYDSAGIAVMERGAFSVVRRAGRVSELGGAVSLGGKCGIGHTRWATHGAPVERNAHPHCYKRFAVVHNGIIENEHLLREECRARGEAFSSDTDSEVIAHLLEQDYEGDLLGALRKTASRLVGSYAVAVLCLDEPDVIALARRASPLVVGVGEGELFAASDVPAIAAAGVRVYALEEGEFALLRREGASFYAADGSPVRKEPVAYDLEDDVPEKKGYRHFMEKEMAEIPLVLSRSASVGELAALAPSLCGVERVQIVACGTAYHSGLCAKRAFEALARVPTEVTVASEYRYGDPIVPPHTLAIAVSQSGETADTLAAAELARGRGALLLAVTNVRYSSLTALADFSLFTQAGREIAVAATKSFNAQLMLLYRLAEALAEAKGKKIHAGALDFIPRLAEEAARAGGKVRGWVPHFLGARAAFFLGRGADYCAALEGSLKLKEISYLPSEGYAAGELKHGTLALVDRTTPVVAVLTDRALAEKTFNAVHETYARGAKVFLVTTLPEYAERDEVVSSVLLPECDPLFSPVLSVLPLQALAYYVSIARGNDPDKPRNLAKSVTVE